MELYENNYMLVRLLAPELRQFSEDCYLSRVAGCLDLELSQIEHNRYTSTFNLTYRFNQPGRSAREPDLTIRLYHDARACEVISGLINSRRSDQRRVRNLDESRRLNRFLYKWIRYCLHQGHAFCGANAIDSVDADGKVPSLTKV